MGNTVSLRGSRGSNSGARQADWRLKRLLLLNERRSRVERCGTGVVMQPLV
jgi:hypothetical protein